MNQNLSGAQFEDYIGADADAGSMHHALHLQTHHGVMPVPDEGGSSFDGALAREYRNKVSQQHLRLHGGKSFRKVAADATVPHRHVKATAKNTPTEFV